MAASSSRSFGMSVGPIPFESVDSYARRHRIAGDAFEDLWHCVRHMDDVYLAKRSHG